MTKNLWQKSKVLVIIIITIFVISTMSLVSVYTKDVQFDKTYKSEQININYNWDVKFYKCGIYTIIAKIWSEDLWKAI